MSVSLPYEQTVTTNADIREAFQKYPQELCTRVPKPSPKFSTAWLMITPRLHCILIFDLVAVHQKLGKSILHALKAT